VSEKRLYFDEIVSILVQSGYLNLMCPGLFEFGISLICFAFERHLER
jgi:hypothetical protein